MRAPVLLLAALLLQAQAQAQAQTTTRPATAAATTAATATATATATAGSHPPLDPVAGYLGDLEKAGVVKTEAGTLDELRAGLVTAEQDVVTGNVQTATTRLFALVESSRFDRYKDDPEFVNAELTLGRALIKGGAYGAAERYLLRVLARGPAQSFFPAAYRAVVDLALETHDEAAVLARLEGVAPADRLPKDSVNERAYLTGKVMYASGQLPAAAQQLSTVDRQSRFFASALYFRGLIDARTRHFASARRNLCEIVEQADNDHFAFFVDGRYWAIKELAFLALGRIAHEQGRYDDAYYFYFRVPEDSERLPDALFEASWSMFQKGEYEASRAFIEQFDRAFPDSPLAPDVLLLHAMIDLKSCRFDRVRSTLDVFVSTYAPIQAEVARLIGEPERRRSLYRRLLGRQEIGRAHDPIVELLKLDPRFYRYFAYLTALDRESGLLPQEIAVWDELTAARAGSQGASARGAQATEAVQLEEDARALAADSRGEPGVHEQALELLAAAQQAARPVSPQGPFASEAARLQVLGQESRRLRANLVDAISKLAEGALIDLDRRLKGLLRQARLTHIDAVIGKKKRLEIEIANLAEGRYPTEMLGRLETEGLIGDDEEYWPYEGEYWADEYENFR